MKTSRTLFFLALAFCTTACDPDEPSTTTEKSFRLTTGASYYWGNAGDIWQDNELAGSNVVAIDLYSENLSYDTESQEYVGTGYNLYIENIFLDTNSLTLAPGTYVMDSLSGAPFTFTPGIWTVQNYPYGAYLITVTSTAISYEIISSGTFTVTEKGDSTLIDFTLQTEDGTTITPQFRGILDAYDASGSYDYSYEPQPATEQDWTFLRADTAICYGDYYGNGTATVDLLLSNDEVFAYLELNCPMFDNDSIPTGTYKIDSSHQAYTVTASQGFSEDEGVDWPSFIGIYASNNTYTYAYYLMSGTLAISRTDSQYAVELNAVSYYGSRIRATYAGTIHVARPTQKSLEITSKPAVKTRTTATGKRGRMAYGTKIQP